MPVLLCETISSRPFRIESPSPSAAAAVATETAVATTTAACVLYCEYGPYSRLARRLSP